MSGQINKKNKQTIKALVNLMKDVDQKYSIRVGIIGQNASAQHPESGLTNADLGAIHEFGATINVTEKMRAYLHHIGIHLKKDTTTVVIPTRSFLRMPLLSEDFKGYVMEMIKKGGLTLYEADALGKDAEGRTMVRELNMEHAKEALTKDAGIMEKIANIVASEALAQVQRAFESGGFGKWAPISPITAQNRKGDSSSPPLTDTGELRNSITAEVRKI